MFTFRRVTETREDVFASQVREVDEDLLLCHSRGEVGEHVVHRDAHAADARLSPRFPGSTVMMPSYDMTPFSPGTKLFTSSSHSLSFLFSPGPYTPRNKEKA
jgi:hypothetical protein